MSSLALDHIAVCARTLDEGCDWVEARLGIRPRPGGKHARYGTHNCLLGMGDGFYFEVIAPDPDADHSGPRWFGLDHPPEVPRIGNWICRCAGLAEVQTPVDAGVVTPLERGALRWNITVPEDGSMPLDGAFPTLIEWTAGQHPSTVLADSGLRLQNLHISHPQVALVRDWLIGHLGDPRVTLTEGPLALTASFIGPHGTVNLA
ncbi:VOC family protein [Ketogulonicigenium vulgare]|uniref:VOC family protein n=1 Tax=Ketogulonicigenium vulgare TaxID=92945 RepID=UPI002359B627|nr:VOC family protein [Ketogulonicigenium vulgare]